MKIVLLGFEGCLPSGIVGLADMFWLAGQAGQRHAKNDVLDMTSQVATFEVITASVDGQPLHDGRGRPLTVDAAVTDIVSCDAILIPGLVEGADGLPPDTPAMQKVITWLRRQHAHGAMIGGSCAGVFVLGEAGLLNGRRCTTTWWLHEELTRRYPRADTVWSSALLEDQGVVTAGGPLSWIDLALHVIRRLVSPEAARVAADFTVVDNTRLTQTIYAPQRYISERDPLLLNAEQAVRQSPSRFTAVALAHELAISERTLHRKLKALVNESPKTFMTRIRLEMACTLLNGQGVSIKRVAQQSGYEDEGSFRRAFIRFTGMTPSAYRHWLKKRQRTD